MPPECQGLQTLVHFLSSSPCLLSQVLQNQSKVVTDNPEYLGTLLFRSRIRHGSKIALFLYQFIQSIITEKGVGWYCSAFTQNRSIKTSYKVAKVLKAWDLDLRRLEFKLGLSDLFKIKCIICVTVEKLLSTNIIWKKTNTTVVAKCSFNKKMI